MIESENILRKKVHKWVFLFSFSAAGALHADEIDTHSTHPARENPKAQATTVTDTSNTVESSTEIPNVAPTATTPLLSSPPIKRRIVTPTKITQHPVFIHESRWNGEITEIATVTIQHKEFVTLQISTASGLKTVLLAPISYIGSPFRIGEQISVEGTEQRVNRLPEIVAFRVIKGDGPVISCRSAKGIPLWPKDVSRIRTNS